MQKLLHADLVQQLSSMLAHAPAMFDISVRACDGYPFLFRGNRHKACGPLALDTTPKQHMVKPCLWVGYSGGNRVGATCPPPTPVAQAALLGSGFKHTAYRQEETERRWLMSIGQE